LSHTARRIALAAAAAVLLICGAELVAIRAAGQAAKQ